MKPPHLFVAALFALLALVMPHCEILITAVFQVLAGEKSTFAAAILAVCAVVGALLISRACALYTLSLLLCFYVGAWASFIGLARFTLPILRLLVFLVRKRRGDGAAHGVRWKCGRCGSMNGVYIPKCERCGNEITPIL